MAPGAVAVAQLEQTEFELPTDPSLPRGNGRMAMKGQLKGSLLIGEAGVGDLEFPLEVTAEASPRL